ncbi:MAG: hypothetical protein JNJ49_01110 [Bdellovibrionaceae bacterium]|nr:hypothetical protein [Pseudobdellovibrionaceae bacterium]
MIGRGSVGFLLAILMIGTSAMAEATAESPAGAEIKLKILMHTFRAEMERLRPFLVSEEKFQNPKARPLIEKSLAALQDRTQGSAPQTIEANPGFRLNFAMMSYHFKKTKQAFDLGAYELARQNLNATGTFCIGCHSQMPEAKGKTRVIWGDEGGTGPVTMDTAEYLFVMRYFDLALKAYDDLARGFPKNKMSSDQFPLLYRRKLALLARVKRSPDLALQNLRGDLENKKLPAAVVHEVKAWIESFEAWKKESSPLESLETSKLLVYVKDNMPKSGVQTPVDSDVVRYLRFSGLLYERLLKDTGALSNQETLYRLAQIEKTLSQKYWYSLHQSYWRECVISFPKSDVTKLCFDAYAKDIEDQFAGRAHVPAEIQSTVEALKRYL